MMDSARSNRPTGLIVDRKTNLDIGIEDLRKAIPVHCFKPSYRFALAFLVRDITLSALLMVSALIYIPQIHNYMLRCGRWALYGYFQDLAFTGLWVLGHECGHMALSPSSIANDIVGFILHSSFLTPYFSWKFTHRSYHIYANNLTMDHNYVPPTWKEYRSRLPFSVNRVEELTGDSPLFVFLHLLVQQVLGWPCYLLTNITAGPGSLMKAPASNPFGNGHFSPTGSLFRDTEVQLVLISDLGLALVGYLLWHVGSTFGFQTLISAYFQPYLWLNHWIVAINYLHHTHPAVPKYEAEAWTFLKGVTATIDRNFGWIGKHILRGIVEFHVIHHLFPQIPFYHAEEATKAIIPFLGTSYRADKEHGFFKSLWETFKSCQWVEPDDVDAKPKDRVMWYREGPLPYPMMTMAQKER